MPVQESLSDILMPPNNDDYLRHLRSVYGDLNKIKAIRAKESINIARRIANKYTITTIQAYDIMFRWALKRIHKQNLEIKKTRSTINT